MNALYNFSQLLGLISFGALIWLVVRAFKKHVLWGLGVLFLSPITATIYAVKYWDEVKKPFLVYITTGLTGLAIAGVVFTAWGGWKAVGAAKRVHDGIVHETLTEEDAFNFMQANMDFMENTDLSEEDQQKLGVMRQFLNHMHSAANSDDGESTLPKEEKCEFWQGMLSLVGGRDTEASAELRQEMARAGCVEQTAPKQPRARKGSGAPETDVATQEPDQSASEGRNAVPPERIIRLAKTRPVRHRHVFKPISVAKAKNYLGAPVIVTRSNGAQQKCTLVDVRANKLLFEKRLGGGSVSFTYHDYEIKSLQVLQDEAY